MDPFKAFASGGLTQNPYAAPALVSPVPSNATSYAGGSPMSYNMPTYGKVFGPPVPKAPAPRSGGLGPTGALGVSTVNLPQGPDPMEAYKNEISSKWDSYLGSLAGEQTGFENQRNAQQGIANTQYQSGVDTLNQGQTKSLQDIGNNIKSAFQAGNNYLGSMGAGDSSAANQYSFALEKEGMRQKSDVNEFVMGHMKDLA